mmetsp:Transcript_8974/g.15187  ORF Transcript_8974/g.15187 Transcript_8974/m.15187 type:complete len:98 (+) Transcript_8974:137-430(+)
MHASIVPLRGSWVKSISSLPVQHPLSAAKCAGAVIQLVVYYGSEVEDIFFGGDPDAHGQLEELPVALAPLDLPQLLLPPQFPHFSQLLLVVDEVPIY